ncbi:response regulator transcription factor [Lyngbya confervoides]|uniref:Response regulator transcription factor n=1 Tax=Lyngbya confervoides BDU141951 TaxID=1574623 RepID=A0ABD4T7J5_9CYAN|nr:response regulator transcription factor [Lyngbya confervoides]MCM1984465.1 response regulator transcription factor [Lyngbya confervoides BDU141951]
MSQILVIEDEPRIASFVEKGLKSEGYAVTLSETAAEGINWATQLNFDLVILDLGLPDQDGLEVLQTLKGQGVKTPIIILTARDDIDDKVTGLELGADDYMTKPFSFKELLARIKVRLRISQSESHQSPSTLRVGSVVLDLKSRKAKLGDEWIELPTREFTLAETFFRHPGQVLSRQQLLDQVWGYDYDPGSNIVDVYVGYLRKRLGNNLIETVRGAGYRLNGELDVH